MAPRVDLGKLFGKGAPAEQLLVWGILAQVLGAVLAPELTMLQRATSELLQATPLTPAELADMVVRHVVSVQEGADYAKQSGIAPTDFQRLVQSAGEGLAPGELAEALRRGIIPERGTGPAAVTFEQGIAESHLRDKYMETVKRLAVREPTPDDALGALLEGQLTPERARELYERFGGDPEHFGWLFDARGSAPTPLELVEMANRGIIPWDGQGPDVTSFLQGFLEGPWRNKWVDAYRRVAEYRPPVRSIVAMLRSGAIDDAKALQWLREQGASEDTAAAMLADAHHQRTNADRELAKSDVLDLYQERVISAPQATEMLRLLHYSDESIAFLLAARDFRRVLQAQNAAIGRLHSLYVARKIAQQTVVNAFGALHVPSDQQAQLLGLWDIERTANTKTLTAAEIASAFFYKVIDQGTAMEELQNSGYDAREAWILLSVRQHAPLPNTPAGVVVPPRAQ